MTSDYKDVAGCTVALVAMPFAVIAEGYVLSVIWSWFMVPTLHLPALGIAQSMGVALVVGMLTHQNTARQQQAEELGRTYYRDAVASAGDVGAGRSCPDVDVRRLSGAELKRLQDLYEMQVEVAKVQMRMRPEVPWIGASYDERETGMLFEIAVVMNPTKKDAQENEALETLVLGPVYQVAKDKEVAALKVMRSPAAAELDVDRCSVLVRPFV